MATVGDHVWEDANGNGLREGFETPISGVIVEAFNLAGAKVGEDITNGAGVYSIDYLEKDDHYLKFTPPSGFILTSANVGSDETLDSDVDNTNGQNTTGYYSMTPGDHVPNVDAGFVEGVVLSVELADFDAEYSEEKVFIDWTTIAEINSDYFEVERRHSTEEDFTVIGKVKAQGESEERSLYDMVDYDVYRAGQYYYRLNMVDRDGDSVYSEILLSESDGG